MKHVISVLVENQPGVLARVVGLISGRGYNIDSLNVGPTEDASVSRMTIQVPGDDRVLEQVTKQLEKLVDVVAVTDLTRRRHMERELVIAKVAVSREERSEILEVAEILGGRVMTVDAETLTVQVVGDRDTIATFLELLRAYRIIELSRSGVIAMTRGDGDGNGENGVAGGGPGEAFREA